MGILLLGENDLTEAKRPYLYFAFQPLYVGFLASADTSFGGA